MLAACPLLHAAPQAIADPPLNFTPVFTPHEGGYPCIRIPSLLLVGNKVLLAFAECRNFTGDGCRPAAASLSDTRNMNRDLCMKSSSDGGRTWSALAVIQRNAMQPTPVWDAVRGQVLLSFNRVSNGLNLQMYSLDLGESWSTPVSIAAFLGPQGPYDVGPGVGLQLQRGKHVGRLLFIGHHDAYEYDGVWYSDDGGATYNMSVANFSHMDEAQLVELPDGRVLASMRNNHLNATCKCQALAVSTDGGASFGPVYYDPTLITPVCMASVLVADDRLYFVVPANTTSRVNGVIRASDDGGRTWAHSLTVTEGAFAYSCLSLSPTENTLGLLWETAMSAHVCAGESCQTVFSTFPALF